VGVGGRNGGQHPSSRDRGLRENDSRSIPRIHRRDPRSRPLVRRGQAGRERAVLRSYGGAGGPHRRVGPGAPCRGEAG
jgi:hypothetical protein